MNQLIYTSFYKYQAQKHEVGIKITGKKRRPEPGFTSVSGWGVDFTCCPMMHSTVLKR